MWCGPFSGLLAIWGFNFTFWHTLERSWLDFDAGLARKHVAASTVTSWCTGGALAEVDGMELATSHADLEMHRMALSGLAQSR